METTADLGLPGVYYVEVNATDGVPSPQPFTLSLGFTAVPDRFEQNQDTAHAAKVRADETWEAYIFPRLDHDVYTLTVQTAGELTLAAENVPANLRLMSMVYDAQPHEMWATPHGSEEAGRPFSTTADLPVARGYYIGIWQNGDSERSLQPIRFRTSFVPAPDPYEPNPEASRAAKVDVNATSTTGFSPSTTTTGS